MSYDYSNPTYKMDNKKPVLPTVIESAAESVMNTDGPTPLEEALELTPKQSRSMLSTVVTCAPYVIMGLGAYMLFSRARAFFKPNKNDQEAQG